MVMYHAETQSYFTLQSFNSFVIFILGVVQTSNRVNLTLTSSNGSQQIQRSGQRRIAVENDTPSSSRSLREKVLRCFAKKYILLCLLCGGLCLSLGVLYLVIFFLLSHYTTSLHYFQTLPTYIPAVVVSKSQQRK